MFRTRQISVLVITITTIIFSRGLFSEGALSRSNFNYITPDNVSKQNRKIINDSFNSVWNRLVQEISSSFFVINNIDKQSGFINISFSSNNPEEYIDCGEFAHEYSFDGIENTYAFKIASDSDFKIVIPWEDYKVLTAAYDLNHETQLEGSINLHAVPISDNKTQIIVNVKYIFLLTESGKYMIHARNGDPFDEVWEKIDINISRLTFNSNQVGSGHIKSTARSIDIKCISKNSLETQLLEWASN